MAKRIFSEEHKRNMSKNHRTKRGFASPMKGKKIQPHCGYQKGHPFYEGGEKGWFKEGEHRSPATEFKKGQIASETAFKKGNIPWNKGKGNKTPLRGQIYNLNETKQWRSDVYKRDNWTCQTCGKRGFKLHAHHSRKSFGQIIKENNIINIWEAQLCKEFWDIDNGVTLCEKCHRLTHSYGKHTSNKGNYEQ